MKRGFRRVFLVAVAAAVVGGAGGVTTAAFNDPTSNAGNAFEASATFGTCPSAGQTTVLAEADAALQQEQPTSTMGLSPSIGVLSFYDAALATAKNYRSVIRFPLPTVPSGCSVTAATLQLSVGLGPIGRTIAVTQASGSWTEGAVNWANQPASTGTPSLAPSPAAMFGPVAFDVLGHLQAMYAGTNDGFVVRDSAEDSPTQAYQWMTSRESWPALSVTFGSVGCSAPGTTTVNSDADTFVDEAQPTANHGSRGTMYINSEKPAANRRALVRFPLPPVPTGCLVTGASLRLGAMSPDSSRTLHAYQAATSWDEGTVTWNDQPAALGLPAATTAGVYPTFDVLTQVTAMYAGVNTGFVVRDATEGSGGGGRTQWMGTREGAPRLLVTLG
jgi:hypothetical protein